MYVPADNSYWILFSKLGLHILFQKIKSDFFFFLNLCLSAGLYREYVKNKQFLLGKIVTGFCVVWTGCTDSVISFLFDNCFQSFLTSPEQLHDAGFLEIASWFW